MTEKEYLDIFLEEFEKNLNQATEMISKIKDNKDEESIDTLCRCFHTIKGSAAMLGHNSIRELAEKMEISSKKIKESNEVKKEYSDLLRESIIQLQNERDLLIKTGRDGHQDTKKFIQRYEHFIDVPQKV